MKEQQLNASTLWHTLCSYNRREEFFVGHVAGFTFMLTSGGFTRVRHLLQAAAVMMPLFSVAIVQAAAPADAHPSLFRASTLEKLKIRNMAGDDLGKINDLVIDANTGKITYVALDFGGFLGVGDKMFAVPWHAFKYEMADKEEHLVLDIPKERLKNAPGFDKNHWPNMANPEWSIDVDKFYGPPRTARR